MRISRTAGSNSQQKLRNLSHAETGFLEKPPKKEAPGKTSGLTLAVVGGGPVRLASGGRHMRRCAETKGKFYDMIDMLFWSVQHIFLQSVTQASLCFQTCKRPVVQ